MSRSVTVSFSASATLARISWTLTRLVAALLGALEELLLVLLELLGGDAAAHVLLDELAQHALGLGLDQARRRLEADLVGQGLGHLAPLRGAVLLLLLELEVRADLVLEALEVVDLVGLEEGGVELREHALADLKASIAYSAVLPASAGTGWKSAGN
jgi:hypothetical protein